MSMSCDVNTSLSVGPSKAGYLRLGSDTRITLCHWIRVAEIANSSAGPGKRFAIAHVLPPMRAMCKGEKTVHDIG